MITPIYGTITTTPGNADTGILFYENGNQINILDISADSPFAYTNLRNGMLVVSVNNVPCEGQTVEFISDILKNASGTVTIQARHDSSTMGPLEPDINVQAPTAPSVPAPNPVAIPFIPVVTNASVVQSASQQPVVANTVHPIVHAVDVVPQQGQTTGGHPPGVEGGGQWGRINFIGEKTLCIGLLSCCFFWPGLFICCCPIDERDAYCVDGRVYAQSGKYLGSGGALNFRPHRN